MQEDEAGGPIAAALQMGKPREGSRRCRVQNVMPQVYARLASWHGMVELGVHHAGEDQPADPQNPVWIRAEVALEEASQYSKDAGAALERARLASMSARWFDEIRADGV